MNYYEYHREKAIKLLSEKYGYKSYGEKHCESVFTKWFQNVYLTMKFGLDKRVPHLSSMINSAQITRQQALEEIEKYPEFISMPFTIPPTTPTNDYKDFPNGEWLWLLLGKMYAKIK